MQRGDWGKKTSRTGCCAALFLCLPALFSQSCTRFLLLPGLGAALAWRTKRVFGRFAGEPSITLTYPLFYDAIMFPFISLVSTNIFRKGSVANRVLKGVI